MSSYTWHIAEKVAGGEAQFSILYRWLPTLVLVAAGTADVVGVPLAPGADSATCPHAATVIEMSARAFWIAAIMWISRQLPSVS